MLQNEIFPGLIVYSNIIPENLNIIDRLESAIKESNRRRSWQNAEVGYKYLSKNYRDCSNIKIQKKNSFFKTPYEIKLDSVWQDIYDIEKPLIDDYCKKFNIEMNYWEAMNFIKYEVGQHFDEHSDHGYSYICTVSTITYLNDNYDGGELYFPKINIRIKPEAGQFIVFPSTYLFSHIAEPVTKGTKYCIATMLDYNNNNEKIKKD